MTIPANVFNKIAQLGAKLDDHIIEETRALYEPLYKQMAAADAEHVILHQDYSYGEYPQQRLDLYQPAQVLADKNPILIFIHGGGYTSGDKANYANAGNYFAKQGYLTVVADYRLAPDFIWPSGAEDVANVIAWAVKHAPEFNADPNNIFLMGHSAGASHVCDYAINRNAGPVNAGVRGLILISGPGFDLSRLKDDHVYYHAVKHDATYYTVNNLANFILPIFTAFAEYEPRRIAVQNYIFVKALANKAIGDQLNMVTTPGFPVIKTVTRHNHVSIMRSFNAGDESLSADVLRFMRRYAVFA